MCAPLETSHGGWGFGFTSGHGIQLEKPEVVIAATEEVLAEARDGPD